MKKIKVLIIDDSAVIRMTLSKYLNKAHDIEVIAVASDPIFARDKIVKLNPDVITLDVEMPRMDGLTFLKKLMTHYPIPVIMVSALTQKNCDTTLNCLAAGAIDFVTKPDSFSVEGSQQNMIEELIDKIRLASTVKMHKVAKVSETNISKPVIAPFAMINSTHKVIAIGASTGGTEALFSVLTSMPSDTPGIVVVQHMPEKFTASFAERLNSACTIEVREARDGDSVIPGCALIAPGNYHMQLKRSGARYFVHLNQEEAVSRHRPSVDVLFDSVAQHAGSNAVGVIMTGMGSDGAKGMSNMKRSGAKTIAQDEESCVVFGMPKEAIKAGAVDDIVPLGKIPDAILRKVTS